MPTFGVRVSIVAVGSRGFISTVSDDDVSDGSLWNEGSCEHGNERLYLGIS